MVELITYQAFKFDSVDVAFLKGSGYWTGKYSDNNVGVTNLRLRCYGDVLAILRLRDVIRKSKPDVVHAHMPPAELYARLALATMGGARPVFVVTKHNDAPFYKGPGHRLLGRWVGKRAAKVIAISDAVRRYITEVDGICRPGKSLTIHYGLETDAIENVDWDDVRQVRTSWGVDDDGLLIGTISRLAPQKALHVLLEGFALFRRDTASSSKLVIVGQGPLESRLKSHAAGLGIEPHVIWAGFREDIPAVMNALDVFALTSVHEGFGLVLLEAMAARKPVVASGVGAIPEVVQDNVTGMLVPPEDPHRVCAALRFFEDRENRSRFGAAGYRRLKAEFDIARMVEKTEMVYRECLTAG